MHMFDASAMIHGWDNYPKDQFQGLWTWLETQVSARLATLSDTAYGEVGQISPDCAKWLKDNGLEVVRSGPAVLTEATGI